METPTQTALVLAAQAGDQKAFETLVGAYQRELLVHCYRMLGSLSDAEDLVRETLLRAWEKRATFTSPQSYRAWLYRIATNLCLNRLTRAPRRSCHQRPIHRAIRASLHRHDGGSRSGWNRFPMICSPIMRPIPKATWRGANESAWPF